MNVDNYNMEEHHVRLIKIIEALGGEVTYSYILDYVEATLLLAGDDVETTIEVSMLEKIKLMLLESMKGMDNE